MTSHTHCTHPATKAARALCRRGITNPVTPAERNRLDMALDSIGRRTKRTDVHAPAAVVLEDYDYFGAYDLGGNSEDDKPYMRELKEAERQYSHSGIHGGYAHCDHCGARIRYGAILVHTPTSTTIHVGETCLDNRFSGLATTDFQRLRKEAALNRERSSLDSRFAARCIEHSELVWTTYMRNIFHDTYTLESDRIDPAYGTEHVYNPDSLQARMHADFEERVLTDLHRSIRKYDKVSDKQLALVTKLLAQIDTKYADMIVREAEAATRPDCPEGKLTITGEVVSLKTVENDFGISFKMVVRDDRGFAVYVTVPSSINPDKGDRVTFSATITRSDRDRLFGFGKRPTKAAIINA